ncbi:MaoC family dehydratase [Paracoccus aminophilus]|uniref:MaoC-like dehydratase n=1 Tax=Paracoccus aminophilus JCM 7686 TaxID=1367847 RepID=S5YHC6_PARAH|nr:MaoC family dehydratase [Paracoccus aminophilus]AGT10868.1 MaoC-like dehydratase [Paracoccus aminophilus JCM 7686]
MALTAQAIMAHEGEEIRQEITPRDAILYALSVGYGTDDLPFVAGPTPRIAPDMANVLCHPGFFMQAVGATWAGVVHAEQRVTFHDHLTLNTPLIARTRATAVVDKGEGRGMFTTFAREIRRESDGAALVTVSQTDACRFDGGTGQAGTPPEALAPLPERAPDQTLAIQIPERAALLYQLNGDTNPLHSDPEVARASGFDAPILHGLCSFGHAARAITRAHAGRLREIAARFTAVVYPGEALELDLWRDAQEVRFRLRVPARSVTALDRGLVRLD